LRMVQAFGTVPSQPPPAGVPARGASAQSVPAVGAGAQERPTRGGAPAMRVSAPSMSAAGTSTRVALKEPRSAQAAVPALAARAKPPTAKAALGPPISRRPLAPMEVWRRLRKKVAARPPVPALRPQATPTGPGPSAEAGPPVEVTIPVALQRPVASASASTGAPADGNQQASAGQRPKRRRVAGKSSGQPLEASLPSSSRPPVGSPPSPPRRARPPAAHAAVGAAAAASGPRLGRGAGSSSARSGSSTSSGGSSSPRSRSSSASSGGSSSGSGSSSLSSSGSPGRAKIVRAKARAPRAPRARIGVGAVPARQAPGVPAPERRPDALRPSGGGNPQDAMLVEDPGIRSAARRAVATRHAPGSVAACTNHSIGPAVCDQPAGAGAGLAATGLARPSASSKCAPHTAESNLAGDVELAQTMRALEQLDDLLMQRFVPSDIF